MKEREEFNIKQTTLKEFINYNDKIKEHKKRFFNYQIELLNMETWDAFKSEVIELSNYYNDFINKLANQKISLSSPEIRKNKNYLEKLIELINAIEIKYDFQIKEEEFPILKEKMLFYCIYEDTLSSLKEVRNQSVLDVKHHIPTESLRDFEGHYFLVSANLKEIFDALINQQQKYYDAYISFKKDIFGDTMNEEAKRGM